MAALWVVGVVFATVSVIGAGVTLLVPETMGRKLPNSVTDIEKWPLMPSKEERNELFTGLKRRKKRTPEIESVSNTVANDDGDMYRNNGVTNPNFRCDDGVIPSGPDPSRPRVAIGVINPMFNLKDEANGNVSYESNV